MEEISHCVVGEISNKSVSVSVAFLKNTGLWIPNSLIGWRKLLYRSLTAIFLVSTVGICLFIQMVALITNFGDLSDTTEVALLLFTNLAHSAKIFNIIYRKKMIEMIMDANARDLNFEANRVARKIVIRCNEEVWFHQKIFTILTYITVMGWLISPSKGEFPVKAWYPYNAKISPYYELTYLHQASAIFLSATLNVCMDSLVVALIAQIRCRLLLVRHKLTSLTEDLEWSEDTELIIEENIAITRLHDCVRAHQSALELAAKLEIFFAMSVLAQFTVSLLIICVTAFQLALTAGSNVIRLASMGTYLLNMVFQVFIYCWHGNQLTLENLKVLEAAYECSWYRCSNSFKRDLLILTTRCFRSLQLTAGGFVALSLRTLMAIMKVSYSFFSVLKQIDEEKN